MKPVMNKFYSEYNRKYYLMKFPRRYTYVETVNSFISGKFTGNSKYYPEALKHFHAGNVHFHSEDGVVSTSMKKYPFSPYILMQPNLFQY